VKPGLVLDIDETSLSNYGFLEPADFSATALVAGALSGTLPAIAPSLDLYDFARDNRVKVFFITGRPPNIHDTTVSNLEAAGFDRGYDLRDSKPLTGGPTTIAYKTGERKQITRRLGVTILANVGDQESDLAGGFAEQAYKLPNPFYFIP
jgi:predicted secreted acid phosphatase